MHELPNEYLADAMALAKKITIDNKLDNYNLLQVRSHSSIHSLGLLHLPQPTHDSNVLHRTTEE